MRNARRDQPVRAASPRRAAAPTAAAPSRGALLRLAGAVPDHLVPAAIDSLAELCRDRSGEAGPMRRPSVGTSAAMRLSAGELAELARLAAESRRHRQAGIAAYRAWRRSVLRQLKAGAGRTVIPGAPGRTTR